MDTWIKRAHNDLQRITSFEIQSKWQLNVKCLKDFSPENPSSVYSLYIGDFQESLTPMTAVCIARMGNLESIHLSLRYTGTISPSLLNSWISAAPNLKRLNIGPRISWKTLSLLNLCRIESLHVSLSSTVDPLPIKAPALKELTIYGLHDELPLTPFESILLDRCLYDFSGMPNIEKLDINYWPSIDLHSLSTLTSLKNLTIRHSEVKHLDWLSSNYQLDRLCVNDGVSSLSGLEKQPYLTNIDIPNGSISDISILSTLKNLESVSLNNNQISDITPIKHGCSLFYLNLQRNPIKNPEVLRKIGIQTLILDECDRERSSIQGSIMSLTESAARTIRYQDKANINTLNAPDYYKRSLIRARLKPFDERVKDHVSSAIENQLKELTPYRYPYFKTDYYDFFLKEIMAQYPFFNPPNHLFDRISYLKNRPFYINKPTIGRIIYSNDDLYEIQVLILQDTQHLIEQKYAGILQNKSVSNSKSILNSVKRKLKLLDPTISLDSLHLSITYNALYGLEIDEKASSAIAIAVLSALTDRPIKANICMCAKFNDNGSMIKNDPYIRDLNSAYINGLDIIIACHTKNTNPVQHDHVRILNCQTLSELISNTMLPHSKCLENTEMTQFEQLLYDMLRCNVFAVVDRKRLIALLNDYFSQHTLQLNLLKLLIQMGLLDEIERKQGFDTVILNRYAHRLHTEFGINIEEAIKVTQAWCICYSRFFQENLL